jgi:hypothetical protein
MKWSGGDSFGFMTANAIRFGSDLLAEFEAFSHSKILGWHDINGARKLNTTLQDHFLDSSE